DVEEHRLPPPWQIGESAGTARIQLAGDTAWWVLRSYGDYGSVDEGVFVTDYSDVGQLAAWILRQEGRAIPLEPDELRREVARGLRRVRALHEAPPPKLAPELPVVDDGVPEPPAGAIAPERFALL